MKVAKVSAKIKIELMRRLFLVCVFAVGCNSGERLESVCVSSHVETVVTTTFIQSGDSLIPITQINLITVCDKYETRLRIGDITYHITGLEAAQ